MCNLVTSSGLVILSGNALQNLANFVSNIGKFKSQNKTGCGDQLVVFNYSFILLITYYLH